MTLEVVHRHEKLVPESDVEFRPIWHRFLEPVSGACVRGLIYECDRHADRRTESVAVLACNASCRKTGDALKSVLFIFQIFTQTGLLQLKV